MSDECAEKAGKRFLELPDKLGLEKAEIDDDLLRRDCVEFRRLLVKGNLVQVWRAVELEKQPKNLTGKSCDPGDKGYPLLAERICR